MAGKDFTINYSPSASCKVKANSLLKDVFGNIIGNSVKHSGRAVTIDVRTDVVTENMTEYCRVIIEDDGPGIPDARKCDIFNRVSRLARGTKSIGLGLHIVKSLIEDYDGYVWAEDRVHGDHTRGARFVVMLPIAGK